MRRRKPYHARGGENAVGKRLRETRIARGMTQARLAEEIVQNGGNWTIRSTLQMISFVERGKRINQIFLLRDVASVLGVSAEWLINGEKPAPTGRSSA
jgi:transcriptional regulator with XRE-family HTH domain